MTSYVVFGTQVPGDGNCMFSSLLEQLKFPEENAKAYGPMYLRREMIVHFIQNKEVLYPFVKEGIKLTYGIVGEKPLSIKQWLSKMSEDKEWGDSICMMLISSMWSVRIGVIRSDSLKLVSYRNKEGIDDQEMLVLYNCSMLKGHYSAILRYDASVMGVKSIEKSEGYEWQTDKLERRKRGDKFSWVSESEDDYIVISKQRFMELLDIEQKYNDIVAITGTEGGVKKKSQLTDEDIQLTPKKLAKKREKDMPDEVQVVEEGDLICKVCNDTFRSTNALARHIKKFHKDEYNFTCKKCKKGFMNEKSFRNHAKQHVNKQPQFVCGDCKVDFGSRRAYNKHMKVKHGPQVNMPCSFCQKVFHERGNLQQHQAICAQNPGKKEYRCDLCGVAVFNLPKKLLQHKREGHRWTQKVDDEDDD